MFNAKKNTIGGKCSSLESLEDRAFMAGDVSAVMYGSTIYITEAPGHLAESSQVVISQLANGKIRVAGDISHGVPSPVNGGSFTDFSPPAGGFASLSAQLGAGRDSLRILPGVNMNAVSLNMTLTGAGSSDVDTVDIQGLKTKGAVNIITGDGVDNVFVQNTNIGDGVNADDLNIYTGTGSDFVQVGNTTAWQSIKGNLTISTRDSYLENDVDRVVVDLTTVDKWIAVDLGGGSDTLDMLAVTSAESLSIAAYGGDDVVRLREVEVWGGIFANMGEGNDTLDLHFVKARQQMYLDGAAGSDTLIKSYDSTTPTLTATNFETLNGRRIFTSIKSDAVKVLEFGIR